MRVSRWLFAVVLLLQVPLVAAAALPDPDVELAQSYAQQAISLSRSPRAAASLVRLHALRDDVDDLNLFAQTYGYFVDRRGTDPLARSVARMLLLDVEKARGRLNRTAELSRQLGHVNDFYVVGSFDNEGKGGCDTDFGPEANPDLKAAYSAKGHDVSWHKLSVRPFDGYVDLATVVRPNREAVAYAVTFLQANHDARVNLGVGTSGAFRLWVNGQKAASSDHYNYPRPDQTRVAVKLRKGINRVLVKVCQESGPLGFYLRQEGSEGVTAVLPETLPPLEKGAPPAPELLPTVTSALEKLVNASPKDAALRAEYAAVLGYFRAFDDKQHTETVEAERAAEAAPKDVNLLLLAAELQDDDLNLRRKHVEDAVAADPASPRARLALAQLELSHNHPERALPILTGLLSEQRRYGAAALALARTYDALGEWPRASRLIEDALRQFPRLPGAVREAARAARRFDRNQETLDRLRLALALRYDDSGSRRFLSSLLADLSHVDEAASELEHLLKLDPYDNSSRLRLAELYAANGRDKDADRLFEAARQLSPDEPEVHEREGRALLQLGRRDAAIAAFERSLALRPQNPALKEALRSLKGENAAYGLQYAYNVKDLVKEADAFAGEDAVILADYTYNRVQPSGLSSQLQQLATKVYTQRGVDAFRNYPISYSPDRQEIRVLRARITKPDGSVVESYGDADHSINEPWTGMYYDTRTKVLSFPALAPGDVLELQFRRDDTAQENLLSDYWGQVDYVQTTSPKVRYQFIADMPAERALYWNKSRLPAGVKHAEETAPDGRRIYRWTANNVSKIVPEPSMPGWAEVANTLHVSTYKTWEDVGRYYWGLVRDQLTPNDELRKTVDRALTGVDRKDEQAVIRAIFHFVVSNTRYVALEFGIHGYKPYRVDRILARRFGDCKDKASLIHAMLKVAGVDSRLVLLRMRHLGDIGDEPASLAAFNHAIAYVPKYNLFLDGTAEFHGTQELPTADRTANILVVEPGGGSKFLTIPEAAPQDNLTTLELKVALKADGSADIQGESLVQGIGAGDYRRSYQSAATRKATFEQAWAQSFPGLTVKEVGVSDLTKLEDGVTVKYKLAVPRYAEALPNGLRFHPFGSGRAFAQTFAPLSERRFDLMMQSPWVNKLSFRYALPQGYTVAELPQPLSEDSPFGHIRLTFRQEGNSLICEGEAAMTVARVKAGEYAAFRAFLTRADQAFSRKVVALRSAGQTASR